MIPADGTQLVARWVEELTELGYRPDPQVARPAAVDPVGPLSAGRTVVRPGALDRDAAVETIVGRLGARRSGWNAADVRGVVEQLIARTGLVAQAAVRLALAEDLTARALNACVPLLTHRDGSPWRGAPEHVRALTSPAVLEVEADITGRMIARAEESPVPADLEAVACLDVAQREVVAALAGTGTLLVVEGAAGAGKTTTLAAARTALGQQGHRLVVVTPTLKAATVAARELGSRAFSAAWLAHQYGYRWDDHGVWTRLAPGQRESHRDPQTGKAYAGPSPAAALRAGDLLLVDEAGMLDQDTARALLRIADESGARVALVGDRHQLPAVGRGGVLDLAVRWAAPQGCLTLDVVHRFSDPEYARISLAMRTGEPLGTGGEPNGERRGEASGGVFDALVARDQIRIYPTQAERTQALAVLAAASIIGGEHGVLVMAETREQVGALNGAIRDRLVAAGRVQDTAAITTQAGERIGVGDRVATRRNDRALQVANRDTWTLTAIADDGTATVTGSTGQQRVLPPSYVRHQVELAYASTSYGAQGETTSVGHLLLGEHTGAAGAYVGMTRGRDTNIAHLVAESIEDARAQWVARVQPRPRRPRTRPRRTAGRRRSRQVRTAAAPGSGAGRRVPSLDHRGRPVRTACRNPAPARPARPGGIDPGRVRPAAGTAGQGRRECLGGRRPRPHPSRPGRRPASKPTQAGSLRPFVDGGTTTTRRHRRRPRGSAAAAGASGGIAATCGRLAPTCRIGRRPGGPCSRSSRQGSTSWLQRCPTPPPPRSTRRSPATPSTRPSKPTPTTGSSPPQPRAPPLRRMRPTRPAAAAAGVTLTAARPGSAASPTPTTPPDALPKPNTPPPNSATRSAEAQERVGALRQEPAIRTLTPGRLQTERENWQAQRAEAQEADRDAAWLAATAATTPYPGPPRGSGVSDTRSRPRPRDRAVRTTCVETARRRPRTQAPRAGSFRCFPTAAGHVSIQLSTTATKKCLSG